MKIIITGRHSSGKVEVLDSLENYGIAVGREFCTLGGDEPFIKKLYLDPKFERFSEEELSRMYENNAYLCIIGCDEMDVPSTISLSKGISQYTFDNSQALILTPEYIVNLNKAILRNEEIIIVWLDNNIQARISRHANEAREYDFADLEDIESSYDSEFVSTIYALSKAKILYFTNEDPQRVALIIKVLLEHPEEYKELFLNVFK